MRLFRLFKRDLSQEVAGWVEQGLISRQQGESICQLYGADLDGRNSRSAGYSLLMVLGYLFIGLALITLIGANWEAIPREVRLTGLILLTAGTQGFALYRHNQAPEDAMASRGLFLLGNLFYGASIILIAQIYHLGEHMPDGIFWWALGSLPIGVLLKDGWLTLFSLLLALTWFFVEFNLGFFPTLFPLFILSAIYVLVTGPQSKLLFLTTFAALVVWIEALLSNLWADHYYGFQFAEEHFAISAALFLFAYAFSHWLNNRQDSRYRDYGVLLSLWVIRFALLMMFVLSFEEPWRGLIRAGWPNGEAMWSLVLLLCGMAMLLARTSHRLPQTAVLSLLLCATLAALMVTDERSHAVSFQVMTNVAVVAWGIYLVVRGLHGGSSHYFFLGVLAILITALIRYVDLIGDYIGGAMLFMVLAALLLGAAKYWRRKQQQEEQGNEH